MKICILAAGMGSRMGVFAGTVHKALLPLNNQAIISRIIDQFSHQDEFVIATGYKKEQIKDYLLMAYPQRKFTFVDVDNYDQTGSGPGYSLFSCRSHLQEPFIFTACDTLITSPLPDRQHNWMGIKTVDDIEKWCSVKTDPQGEVTAIFYKEKVDTPLAFTGIAFVKDYQSFWTGLGKNRSLLGGELQVNNGLEALIPGTLKALELSWEDAGNEAGYNKLLAQYQANYSFDGKTTDITYRHGQQIIKFFVNSKISQDRFQRAQSYRGIFANVGQLRGNFFSYDFVEGRLLSEINDGPQCYKFLDWAQAKLWQKIPVNEEEFTKICRQFYYQKTMDRLNFFCDKYLPSAKEKECTINGLPCQTVKNLLNQLDDSFYERGLPSGYHGDLHDDNIIIKGDATYALIDWRESFGLSLEAGDRYYDFAKFLHTLDFSVDIMRNERYALRQEADAISIEHAGSSRSKDATKSFWDFMEDNKYDAKRIHLIEALIFINMAPLYARNLGTYLYYLGRHALQVQCSGLLSKKS